MFSTMYTLFARSETPRDAGQAQRLRRIGYLDSERQPRRARHWANR